MLLRKLLILLLFIPIGLQANGNIDAYLKLAYDYTAKNQTLEAIKVCDKILEINPKHEDALFIRGINKYILGEYPSAIADFDLLISSNENYPDAYLYRAKAKKANKDYWAAFKDYNRAKNENFSKTLSSLAGDVVKSVVSSD